MCMNNETLCWNCANACSNGCSWSRELVPVDGWDAVETRKGYLVKACPQFEKETVRVRSASDLDTDGCIELLKAAGATMYRDYMDGTGFYERDYNHPETLKDTIRKNRRAIEVFLKSDHGRRLMMLTDPESVIRALRQHAMKYDESENGEMSMRR